MNGAYDDIICLPHHVSAVRQRMSMIDRAAQFSPFAALTGYDGIIREIGRLTDQAVELAADGKAMLDEKLRHLSDHLDEEPEVAITYFVPDERKRGGAYVNVTGRLRKIDPLTHTVTMADGAIIGFAQIYDISGTINY